MESESQAAAPEQLPEMQLGEFNVPANLLHLPGQEASQPATDTSIQADVEEADAEMSPESLLQGGSFCKSGVSRYWRMANAAYHAASRGCVSQDEHVWEVITHHRPTNTRIIGRELPGGSVEIAFRGTVSEGHLGVRSGANWHTNLDSAIEPLSADLCSPEDLARMGVEVGVHRGFQRAYAAVQSELLAWLAGRVACRGSAPHAVVHLAGHSLGGALATLAAVHLRLKLGCRVQAVVTFGSPRVGTAPFFRLYEQLGLQSRTARFVNRADPVPRVPLERDGFVHVGQAHSVGRPGFPLSSHSMQGNEASYFDTLHDAVETEVVQPGLGGGILTRAGAVCFDAETVVVAAKQELKAEMALVHRDVAMLAEGMRGAERRLKDAIKGAQCWEWLIESQTVSSVLQDFGASLPEYRGLPQWVWEVRKARDKMLMAAKAELQDPKSELAVRFLLMFSQLSLLMIRAMQASGAERREVEDKRQEFVAESRVLLKCMLGCWQGDVAGMVELLRLLGRHCPDALCDLPEAWTPVAKMLLSPDPADLTLDFGADCSHAGDAWSLASHFLEDPNLSTLRIRFGAAFDDDVFLQDTAFPTVVLLACQYSTRARVLRQRSQVPCLVVMICRQDLAVKHPYSLQLLSLTFDSQENFTDVGLQTLAQNLPKQLTSLHLNFGWNENFTDVGLQTLAQNLPKQLTSLHLDFWHNENFTDVGLQALAQNLPKQLTSLHLDSWHNENFTDVGLQALAQNLPKQLTSLHLDFWHNENFTDVGLQALAQNLPKQLTFLHLDFWHNENFTDVGLQALAQNLPKQLTSLHLDFEENKRFTDVGLQTLAQNLPKQLTSLHLDFWRNENFTDVGLQALAQNLPKQLTSLHLDFWHNENFTDVGLQTLAQNLPKQLTSLHVHIRKNKRFTDVGLQTLAQNLPKQLTSLHLEYWCNENFTDVGLQTLAQNLPKQLTSLHLNFGWNENFTDVGLQTLAQNLPKQLTSLHLDLREKRRFTDVGLQTLAQNLPKQLTSLRLNFWHNENFTDVGLQTLAQNLPKQLTSLHVDFRENKRFTDVGLQTLAQNLPKQLTSVHLNFGLNENFTDVALQTLAQNLPKQLTSLHLDFWHNENFTDVGLQMLAQNLPKQLTSLHLDFWHNENFTDVGLQTLAPNLPKQLTSLHLNFLRATKAADLSALEFWAQRELHGCGAADAGPEPAQAADLSALGF